MIKGAGLEPKDVVRLQSGHSPFLSRVDELASIVARVVNVETQDVLV